METTKKPCGCMEPCACNAPISKKMKANGVNVSGIPGFKLESPVYKGNAVLNAQK